MGGVVDGVPTGQSVSCILESEGVEAGVPYEGMPRGHCVGIRKKEGATEGLRQLEKRVFIIMMMMVL